MGILMFIAFLLIIGYVSLEFIIVYQHMDKLRMKLHYYYSGHIILSDLVYTKYFVTEGVIRNLPSFSDVNFSFSWLCDFQ